MMGVGYVFRLFLIVCFFDLKLMICVWVMFLKDGFFR